MSPGHLDRQPVYRQIAGYYAERIRNGAIKPGDKLPSVADLCRIWNVANGTAVAAIVALREDGLVETGRRGTFALPASNAGQ